MEHLIAIRVDEIDSSTRPKFLELIQSLSDSAIVSLETAAKTKKIHYHAQISVESHIKIESEKKKIRRKIKKSCGVAGSQFYVEQTKDLKKHITYLVKDLEIILNTWKNNELIEECMKETERINNEKNLKMKHQLLIYAEETFYTEEFVTEILVNSNAAAVNINDLFIEIIHYHVVRDYLPPSRTLLTQYAAYIITKCFGDPESGIQYNIVKILLMEIYNI